MQLSASGGGAWASGRAVAQRASWLAGKSIRLTRQIGADTADSSCTTGTGVIGFSALPSEMTQQAVAAQQPSAKDVGCESGCEQHRALGA